MMRKQQQYRTSDHKCTFIDFETTLSGSASGIFVLHLDLEHAFDHA
jgi:hypothetical protein